MEHDCILIAPYSVANSPGLPQMPPYSKQMLSSHPGKCLILCCSACANSDLQQQSEERQKEAKKVASALSWRRGCLRGDLRVLGMFSCYRGGRLCWTGGDGGRVLGTRTKKPIISTLGGLGASNLVLGKEHLRGESSEQKQCHMGSPKRPQIQGQCRKGLQVEQFHTTLRE